MQPPPTTAVATLIGGEANGRTIEVPLAPAKASDRLRHKPMHQQVWVTMVTGEALLPPDPQAPDAYDLLLRAWSRWESYEQVTAITPSQSGRVAYWCTRPLVRRDPCFIHEIPMLIPRDSAAMRRLRLIEGNPGVFGADRHAQWAAITRYLRDPAPADAR